MIEAKKESETKQVQVDSNVDDIAYESTTESVVDYDNKKAATNVSLYLSLTAASSLVSSYFGGKLLDYLTVRQMFIATSFFSILTLASGFIVKEQDSRIPPK